MSLISGVPHLARILLTPTNNTLATYQCLALWWSALPGILSLNRIYGYCDARSPLDSLCLFLDPQLPLNYATYVWSSKAAFRSIPYPESLRLRQLQRVNYLIRIYPTNFAICKAIHYACHLEISKLYLFNL